MTVKRAVIAIIIAALSVGLYFANFGIRTTRIDKLRQLVEQHIAPGASPEQVIQFLNTKHLEHSEFMRREIMHLGPSHNYANQNVIAAIKRRTKVTLISRDDIQIIFVFDESHRLTKIDLIPVYTSL